jgi:hypothetical protein
MRRQSGPLATHKGELTARRLVIPLVPTSRLENGALRGESGAAQTHSDLDYVDPVPDEVVQNRYRVRVRLRRRYLSRNILSVSLGHRTGRGLLHKCSQRGITYPGSCLVCGLFRARVEFCSGLFDLVVGVGHHRGGGHRLTLAGERFVGLVAEEFPFELLPLHKATPWTRSITSEHRMAVHPTLRRSPCH